ncbi:hypothetical protein BJV78DRAFT_1188676 [Lactifluus subvellereus]|nr:hypothetical protein BJV78DRAFT_1188676 [Lactifluus subvellereus]
MEIPSTSHPALNFGEAFSSDPSPLSSVVPSPSLSLVSTPASSVFGLPTEVDSVERGPHDLPTFDQRVAQPTQPTLYLPPFLSSLPHTFSDHKPTVSTGLVPKTSKNCLPDIDPASLSLHKALHSFSPTTEDYAAMSYVNAFNWNDLELPEDDEREWYGITFRSTRRQGSDSGPLDEADRLAHEEAVQGGGLILYWCGIPHPDTRRNLATCIWQSRALALASISRPQHIRAMRLAAASYEFYELERWTLRKRAGSTRLEILPYDSGAAGS